MTLSVPVDGVVTDMVSEPKGEWLDNTNRAVWSFSDVSSIGSIRSVVKGFKDCSLFSNAVYSSQGSVSTVGRPRIPRDNRCSVQL